MQHWWTVRQLAKHYGVSDRTIYDVIASGELVVHRIGTGRGTIRIADADRIAWENRCRAPEPPPFARPGVRHKPACVDLIEKHFGR